MGSGKLALTHFEELGTAPFNPSSGLDRGHGKANPQNKQQFLIVRYVRLHSISARVTWGLSSGMTGTHDYWDSHSAYGTGIYRIVESGVDHNDTRKEDANEDDNNNTI